MVPKGIRGEDLGIHKDRKSKVFYSFKPLLLEIMVHIVGVP